MHDACTPLPALVSAFVFLTCAMTSATFGWILFTTVWDDIRHRAARGIAGPALTPGRPVADLPLTPSNRTAP